MESFLNFCRGPLLVLAFTAFFLGVLRQVALTLVELGRAYRRAGDQAVNVRFIFKRSLGWIIPVNGLRGTRSVYTAASVVFHAGMLLVPLFLAGHVELIRRGLGVAWPSLSPGAADVLTLASIVALATLFVLRLGSRASRFLSTFQDWFLLVLCGMAFLSGYVAAHPAGNPLPFTLVYIVHLLSAELLLVLVPFSKLGHAILFSLTRASWEMGWHFVPGAGERVRCALGKEGEPV